MMASVSSFFMKQRVLKHDVLLMGKLRECIMCGAGGVCPVISCMMRRVLKHSVLLMGKLRECVIWRWWRLSHHLSYVAANDETRCVVNE